MEHQQLSFNELLVVKTNTPKTPEEKMAWLAENTKKHRMGSIDRTEFLEEHIRNIRKE